MAFADSKEKSAVCDKDYSRVCLFIRGIFVIILILSLPIIFLLLFRSNGKSDFFLIHSNMSVSDWFGFWITYISMCVTALLTYSAYTLSKKIENSQFYHQIESNKVYFRFSDVYAEGDRKLKVVFPMDIISMKDVKVENAVIEFGGGETVKLDVLEEQLSGHMCTLIIPPKINNDKEVALTLWRQQMFTRTKKYYIAKLTIVFTYYETSINEKDSMKVVVNSVAQIVVYLDKKKKEKYRIVDTGVSTQNTKRNEKRYAI